MKIKIIAPGLFLCSALLWSCNQSQELGGENNRQPNGNEADSVQPQGGPDTSRIDIMNPDTIKLEGRP
jgi:hypothetical protein